MEANMKNNHIPIQYIIPSLGEINTQIYKPCASLCYVFLEKYGFIEKLKSINQLGVIKNTFNGTQHPRWEYVVLQIYLLNQLKSTEFKSGLGTNIKISINEQEINISSCELIQIWILLLNSGHLPGTFASERGVLAYLKENKDFFKKFNEGLPKNLRISFKEAITNDNVYDIHKFIIAFLLKRHRNCTIEFQNTGLKIVDILIECLKLYISESNNKKINQCKFYFSRIRQISYLFLDSHYTVFPITFNISQFVFNLEHHIKELFSKNSHFNSTLQSFDNLLTNDLYNSKDSIRELSIHSHYVKNKLSSKKLNTVTSIKDIFEETLEIFEPLIKEFDDSYETLYLPFNLESYFPLDAVFEKYFSMNLENELNNLIGKYNLLTIQKSSNKKLITITIVFKRNNYYNHLLAIQKVAKKLISIKHEMIQTNNSIKLFSDIIFNTVFKEIFLFILNKSNRNDDKIFKFDELEQYPNILSINTKKDFGNKQNRNQKNSERYEERLTEKIAKDNINRNKALITFSSLYWYDKNLKKDVHEIDGAIINFKRNKVELILVEAKNQKDKAIKSAKSQLEKTINHINFYSDEESSVKKHYSPKGAYSIIKISNIKSDE